MHCHVSIWILWLERNWRFLNPEEEKELISVGSKCIASPSSSKEFHSLLSFNSVLESVLPWFGCIILTSYAPEGTLIIAWAPPVCMFSICFPQKLIRQHHMLVGVHGFVDRTERVECEQNRPCRFSDLSN